jgi:hypothetical protein
MNFINNCYIVERKSYALSTNEYALYVKNYKFVPMCLKFTLAREKWKFICVGLR